MKVKNKHGRVGVKTPLSHTQRREAFWDGFKKGSRSATTQLTSQIATAKSLRELKKDLGL